MIIVNTHRGMRSRKLIFITGLVTVVVLVLNVGTGEEGMVGEEAHEKEARTWNVRLKGSELEAVLALPDVRSIENWPHGIRSG